MRILLLFLANIFLVLVELPMRPLRNKMLLIKAFSEYIGASVVEVYIRNNLITLKK